MCNCYLCYPWAKKNFGTFIVKFGAVSLCVWHDCFIQNMASSFKRQSDDLRLSIGRVNELSYTSSLLSTTTKTTVKKLYCHDQDDFIDVHHHQSWNRLIVSCNSIFLIWIWCALLTVCFLANVGHIECFESFNDLGM